MTKQFGRNAECPCGSRKKYKSCCLGKVDFEAMARTNDWGIARHFRPRAKNLAFLTEVAAALQLDKMPQDYTWADIKRAVTPTAVRAIHNAVAVLWPDAKDYERCLREDVSATTAVYLGVSLPESVTAGIVRHALYSDRIWLIDPFLHPANVRPDFNPLHCPEKYIAQTLQGLWLWWHLAEWIQEGIVEFIRVPGDFDARFLLDSIRAAEERVETHKELQELLELETHQMGPHLASMAEFDALQEADEALFEHFTQENTEAKPVDLESFRAALRQRRDMHPYFIDLRANPGQYLAHHAGTSLDSAKRVCALSGAHIVTDMKYRWKELEIDRGTRELGGADWSPLAKAFGEVRLSSLENVRLEDALRLRKEGRLEAVRSLLMKAWTECSSGPPFSAGRAHELAAELHERLREANNEWKKIDTELTKLGLAAASAVGAVAACSAAFAAPAAVVSGLAVLERGRAMRKQALETYPGLFLLGHI